MAITVVRSTQPEFPGEWTVMDEGMCYSRHETEQEALNEAVRLRHMMTLQNRVEELMDEVEDQIMVEFNLSKADADRAMQEWMI